jgi:hypothetical protein
MQNLGVCGGDYGVGGYMSAHALSSPESFVYLARTLVFDLPQKTLSSLQLAGVTHPFFPSAPVDSLRDVRACLVMFLCGLLSIHVAQFRLGI